MDIFGKARRLESTLARTLDRAAQQWTKSGPREPLEILHAIVDAVEERLEPAGGGRHVFPFNRIKVTVLAPSRDARARFAAVLDGDSTLEERVATRLRAAGCDPAALRVRTIYASRPEPRWASPDYHIEFDRVPEPDRTARVKDPAPASLRLTIVHGSAEKPSYAFSLARINLGRCAEVRDKVNRLIRTNHVVFAERAADPNPTVSRRHAHIEYVARSRHYRICDDRSAHGTGVVRSGRTITVPSGSRGVRLESGDELVLGAARIRVKIEQA